MKILFYLTIFITFDVFALADNSNCLSFIKHTYLNKNFNPSLEETKKYLGKPSDISDARVIQYKWEDFNILTKNKKIIQIEGIIPQTLKMKKYEIIGSDIGNILPKLKKTEQINKIFQKEYLWKCSSNESYFKIITDYKGIKESYSGRYCRNPKSPLCSTFDSENLILTDE